VVQIAGCGETFFVPFFSGVSFLSRRNTLLNPPEYRQNRHFWIWNKSPGYIEAFKRKKVKKNQGSHGAACAWFLD